jgi:YfiH family protein
MKILDGSALRTKNGLPYFEIPQMAKIGWIRHGFLTRRGGVSSPPYESLNLGDPASAGDGDRNEYVSQNKNLIATAFRFDPKRLILLHQLHQDRILLIRKPLGTFPSLLEYDAMITDTRNTFLGILTADCLPIFIVDREKRVIAAIHAGRQGTALHITSKVLKKMKEEFGFSSKDLIIALGPSIGPCCYEIDEKVFIPEWEPFSTSRGRGRWMVDLARINIFQLEKEGIKKEQIFRINLCTSCHSDLFFSYRKGGRTGRQLSFIGIME